ncbi:MAG: GTPase HflX, partial [Christensenellaceae bacterium]|nr:GTPase HflX [Christensenellaceae bacterium]
MAKIEGNIQGIRKSALNQLEALFDMPISPDVYVSQEILDTICKISNEYNREIAIYISRNGKVLDITIGTNATVELKAVSTRRGDNRLSGVRCIHTHPNGMGRLSNVDTSALLALKFDAITAVGCLDGNVTEMQTATLNPETESGFEFLPLISGSLIPHDLWFEAIVNADYLVGNSTNEEIDDVERVLLVGIDDEASLEELKNLAETANVEVVDMVLQKRSKADSSTYIGEGKVDEIAQIIQLKAVDTLICDDEITSVMQRNLESTLKIKVIDRTALILDIFAKHSKSSESKLQVEAAQLRYRSQRLTGMGIVLSRLGGGIGTRGPGETKLEVDRRRIQTRLAFLEEEIKNIAAQRSLRRKEREKSEIPIIALVGYTNAGKSSLLNQLTDAGAYVEDKLFATLDSLTRKFKLSNGQEVLLVDTVGFIEKLPHFLVKTFASTLEEVALADVIVVVVDSSDDEKYKHLKVVEETLERLKAGDKPTIIAF